MSWPWLPRPARYWRTGEHGFQFTRLCRMKYNKQSSYLFELQFYIFCTSALYWCFRQDYFFCKLLATGIPSMPPRALHNARARCAAYIVQDILSLAQLFNSFTWLAHVTNDLFCTTYFYSIRDSFTSDHVIGRVSMWMCVWNKVRCTCDRFIVSN